MTPTEGINVDNLPVSRGEHQLLEKRVDKIERIQELQGFKIEAIEKSLKTIDDNTTWIKRAILNAIIATVIGIALTGIGSAVWFVIKGG